MSSSGSVGPPPRRGGRLDRIRSMTSTLRAARQLLLCSMAAALFVATVRTQAGPASEANHFVETPKGWVQPKTAWGDPDITGTWPISFVGSVPLERCASFGGPGRAGAPPCDPNKAFLTEAEYQERIGAATKQGDRHAAAIAAG